MESDSKFWRIAAIISTVLLVIAVLLLLAKRRNATPLAILVRPRMGRNGLLVADAIPVPASAAESAAGWWASGYADGSNFGAPGPVGTMVGDSVGASG